MSRIAFTGSIRQRDPRIRNKGFLGFVAGLPCVSCACRGRRTWPVEVAHNKSSFPEEPGWRAFGHSERGHDTHCAPLCSSCHRTGPTAQHANLGGDERTFWEKLGIYPPHFCAALVEAYENQWPGDAVVQRAARGDFPFPASG